MKTNTRNTLIAFAALVMVGIGIWYGLSARKALPDQRNNGIQNPVSTSTNVEAPTVEERAVITGLLQKPEPVEMIRIHPYTFWVRQRVIDEKPEWKETDITWIVDTLKKTHTRLEELSFGYPGPIVSHSENDETFFHVNWSSGWEGSYTNRSEYIERESGRIAYALIDQGGQTYVIRNGTREVELSLAPAHACKNGERNAEVTGIQANDAIIKLSESKTVECIRNDMTGEAVLPSFSEFRLDKANRIVRVVFPWGGGALIPADSLEVSVSSETSDSL